MISHKNEELMKNPEVKAYFDEVNAIMNPLLKDLMSDERYLSFDVGEFQNLIEEKLKNDKTS